jgi:hypothetical protein
MRTSTSYAQKCQDLDLEISVVVFVMLSSSLHFPHFYEIITRTKQTTMTTLSTPVKFVVSLLVMTAFVATHMNFNKVSQMSNRTT